LFALRPLAAGTSARRCMLLAEDVWSLLNTTHEDQELEERIGFLQADLEVFAEGQPIHPKYLFLLYPVEDAVWEIRSVRPAPSIRVLGLFADKDVFVATNYALREELGGWQSREWKQVKRRARAVWSSLFHPYPPMVSTDVNQLVSGAINGKYFKERA